MTKLISVQVLQRLDHALCTRIVGVEENVTVLAIEAHRQHVLVVAQRCIDALHNLVLLFVDSFLARLFSNKVQIFLRQAKVNQLLHVGRIDLRQRINGKPELRVWILRSKAEQSLRHTVLLSLHDCTLTHHGNVCQHVSCFTLGANCPLAKTSTNVEALTGAHAASGVGVVNVAAPQWNIEGERFLPSVNKLLSLKAAINQQLARALGNRINPLSQCLVLRFVGGRQAIEVRLRVSSGDSGALVF